jgi:hypothetical protein
LLTEVMFEPLVSPLFWVVTDGTCTARLWQRLSIPQCTSCAPGLPSLEMCFDNGPLGFVSRMCSDAAVDFMMVHGDWLGRNRERLDSVVRFIFFFVFSQNLTSI